MGGLDFDQQAMAEARRAAEEEWDPVAMAFGAICVGLLALVLIALVKSKQAQEAGGEKKKPKGGSDEQPEAAGKGKGSARQRSTQGGEGKSGGESAKKAPKPLPDLPKEDEGEAEGGSEGGSSKKSLTIIYATQKGCSREFAEKAKLRLIEVAKSVRVVDAKEYDPDQLSDESVVAFVVSTYEGGTPPPSCSSFFAYLKDHALDFRVSNREWQHLEFSVLGLGNQLYAKNYNTVAKNLDSWFSKLNAHRLTSTYLADENRGKLDETFEDWCNSLHKALAYNGKSTNRSQPENRYMGCVELMEESEDEESGSDGEEQEESEDDIDTQRPSEQPELGDLEDIGKGGGCGPKKKYTREEALGFKTVVRETEEELLNPRLRQNLSKQGYKLVGSHSGVKLCRWTKAMLRGRGGCYKHTFYGIKSYQCMEMTPSLACANKCVFCWRHHTNPVTREWRWKMDDAEFLLNESIKNHVGMINALKGVPGVMMDRFEEAKTIRHCALSLVGEPIIYPDINKYIQMMHSKKISSFMVTNAQFPDKIEELEPVTQVYVSIDAATKESLQKIDRPLFSDFWERFLASVDALSRKGQRTVFRLTLVKAWNMEELKNYAALIERGQPEFIEVKGVTYCGENNASDLTMGNVPYHREVVKFCQELVEASPLLKESYGLACEHEHSCCMLIAHRKFHIDGKWNTWIDYDQFHSMVNEGRRDFNSGDYMEETPYWAVYGSEEKGFDPVETRFIRKNKAPLVGGC